MYLDFVFPLSVSVEPNCQESPNLVADAWVASQPSLSGTSLDSSFQNVPVLFLKGFPCPTSDLLAESYCIAGFGIAEVGTGMFPLKDRSVKDMCACVFDRRECRRLVCDFGEDMEGLSGLEGAGL